ncbi:tRNA pseudouridine(38-40) synthase TruA [uncultured Fusobacterium sp.]|uniref:tRNA pseudouridine(38-40) synthase TruA n=1 Tax=uncultured Fusobacterium sp. TaxID=159267 RepID=UPI000BBA74D9|nr:tRNA pseudouridine(38-40) synthase TruA [uncultured Fusobacterium sp.]BBA49810.1 tRNA pseudouridine synthase A [Fusobacterium varium]
MKNIKIRYRFDGSMFYGFQRQPGRRTVQGEIEKLLEVVLREKVNMISAGRTDRGVHALEQVSNFFTNSSIPIEKLKYALSKGLPLDIEIFEAKEVDMEFNSRFMAKSRAYKYIISWIKNPFESRYVTLVHEKMDKDKFLKILKPLVGINDFNNFRLSDCGSKTSIREIYSITAEENENKLIIDIKGNSFLKSQIRIMIGTALNVYLGNCDKNYLIDMLANPNENFIKKVADPYGLYLSEVNY